MCPTLMQHLTLNLEGHVPAQNGMAYVDGVAYLAFGLCDGRRQGFGRGEVHMDGRIKENIARVCVDPNETPTAKFRGPCAKPK